MKYIILFSFIFTTTFIIGSNSKDSIIVAQQIQIDSLAQKISTIEKNIEKVESQLDKPIEVFTKNSIWNNIVNLITIVIGCFTIFYVIKADKINSLYGNYINKKRFDRLKKELYAEKIELKKMKNEFIDILRMKPEDFVNAENININSVREIVNKVRNSPYYRPIGVVLRELNQADIYSEKNGEKEVFHFSSEINSIITICQKLIAEKKELINQKQTEIESILVGENKV